jgi:hypothetical protein
MIIFVFEKCPRGKNAGIPSPLWGGLGWGECNKHFDLAFINQPFRLDQNRHNHTASIGSSDELGGIEVYCEIPAIRSN